METTQLFSISPNCNPIQVQPRAYSSKASSDGANLRTLSSGMERPLCEFCDSMSSYTISFSSVLVQASVDSATASTTQMQQFGLVKHETSPTEVPVFFNLILRTEIGSIASLVMVQYCYAIITDLANSSMRMACSPKNACGKYWALDVIGNTKDDSDTHTMRKKLDLWSRKPFSIASLSTSQIWFYFTSRTDIRPYLRLLRQPAPTSSHALAAPST
jgi:hypothetical protein